MRYAHTRVARMRATRAYARNTREARITRDSAVGAIFWEGRAFGPAVIRLRRMTAGPSGQQRMHTRLRRVCMRSMRGFASHAALALRANAMRARLRASFAPEAQIVRCRFACILRAGGA